jgi:membrane-bound lytic murein transglycosylase B
MFLFISPAYSGKAQKKVKAADLVTDGQPIDITSKRYQDLFAELRDKHGFSQEELDGIFAGISIKQRVLVLMDSQWEARPYYDYWPRFITPAVVAEGKKMLVKYKDILDRVEKEIGVEREVVVAIWGIETRYGRHKGGFDMLQTLNTMFDAYPRRSAFYRRQLVHFLLLCRENDVDPRSVPGSYGAAFGQTQFIPSSFREYAVDFDHDGKRDVWNSEADVLASIANYLKRFHWVLGAPVYVDIGSELHSKELQAAFKKGRKGFVSAEEVARSQDLTLPPVPKDKKGREKSVTIIGLELNDQGGMRYVAGYPNFQAITKWNHSNRYAMAVTELSERLAAE